MYLRQQYISSSSIPGIPVVRASASVPGTAYDICTLLVHRPSALELRCSLEYNVPSRRNKSICLFQSCLMEAHGSVVASAVAPP